jgi:hypothetical protein
VVEESLLWWREKVEKNERKKLCEIFMDFMKIISVKKMISSMNLDQL